MSNLFTISFPAEICGGGGQTLNRTKGGCYLEVVSSTKRKEVDAI